MNLYFLRMKKRGMPDMPSEIIFPIKRATYNCIRKNFIEIIGKYLFDEGDIVLPTKLSISGGTLTKNEGLKVLWKSASLGDFILKMGGNPTKTAE